MNRRLAVISILILVFGAQILIAATSDSEIPGSIRNNKFFLESVRLANLAEKAYEEGDYDASAKYSEEAVRYAQLSDEFVRHQLMMKEADDAIAAARKRLDYAASVNAATRYSYEYSQAQIAYAEARAFRVSEKWEEAIEAANRVLTALANVSREVEVAVIKEAAVESKVESSTELPAQYTVRGWNSFADCLWNIAGQPWVYNNPWKWKTLFEANKSKMPDPNNPNLIEPGMILNIPSIKGETRQGMWEAGKTYPKLP